MVTIGQAGENQVRFALISCEYNRQAGRGGAGAVMGAKNLKAIAVTGSRVGQGARPGGLQCGLPAGFGRHCRQCRVRGPDRQRHQQCRALVQ